MSTVPVQVPFAFDARCVLQVLIKSLAKMSIQVFQVIASVISVLVDPQTTQENLNREKF